MKSSPENSYIFLQDYFHVFCLSVFFFLITIPAFYFINIVGNRLYVAVYSFCIFLFLLSFLLFFLKKKGYNLVLIAVFLYAIYLIAFQLSLAGFFFQGNDAPRQADVKSVIAIKNLVVGGVVFFLLFISGFEFFSLKGKNFKKITQKLTIVDKYFISFFLFILISSIFSPSDLEIKITYFIHSLGIFCLLYFVVRMNDLNARELKIFAVLIIALALFLFVVGLLIYKNTDYIWKDILKFRVVLAGAGGRSDFQWPPSALTTTLEFNGRFYPLRRMVSLVGNTVNYGYLTVFAFVMCLWLKKRIAALLLFIAAFFILSKGALLCLGIICFFYFLPIFNVSIVWLCNIFLSLAIVVGTLFFLSKTAALRLSPIFMVLATQISNPGINTLVGYGIGSGGTLAAVGGFLNVAVAESTGAESALGMIIFTMGLFGAFLWAGIFLSLQVYFAKCYSATKNTLFKLGAGCACGLLISSFFQENIVNMTVFTPYVILFACCINQVISDKQQKMILQNG